MRPPACASVPWLQPPPQVGAGFQVPPGSVWGSPALAHPTPLCSLLHRGWAPTPLRESALTVGLWGVRLALSRHRRRLF